MEIISFIIFFNLILFTLNEISLFWLEGWFLDEDSLEKLENLKEKDVYLNPYNEKILMINTSPIVVSHYGYVPGILAFYHLSKRSSAEPLGRIPIWSKAHKNIRELHKKCKDKKKLNHG